MKTRKLTFAMALFLATSVGLALLVSCGSGTSTSQSATTTGTVATFLSDPPTCEAPNGPFLNVWVTITKVSAHISTDAETNDSGWVDLVDLESTPRQIDLLNLGSPDSTTCVLNQLGSTSGLPPGNYQQIRLHLLANDATGVEVTPQNNCGPDAFNCVVTSGGPQPLLLSSQAQTGLKIPPGQIAGGAITLEAGQSADINIEFNACSSVVMQGNQRFRLKPTLLAGAVSVETSESSISGRVVDDTETAIPGAIVLLEQPDDDGIDRVVRSAVTGSGGQFNFCPLPDGDGPYDVVVAASTFDPDGGVTTTYNATVAFGVPVGTDLGDIPLVPEEVTNGPSTFPATIEGEVTTTVADAVVVVSALQEATANGTTRDVTVPVFGAVSQPPSVTTAGNTCPGDAAACATYSLEVPASNPSAGAFVDGSITFADPAADTVSYSVNGVASSCTVSTPTSPILISVDVTAGSTAVVGTTMEFSGCGE